MASDTKEVLKPSPFQPLLLTTNNSEDTDLGDLKTSSVEFVSYSREKMTPLLLPWWLMAGQLRG